MVEYHPYISREAIPTGTRVLIVGTAPPPRFSKNPKVLKAGDVDFFYGSRDNQLWHMILSPIFGVDFKHKSENAARVVMQNFLSRHRIWMTDILAQYRRKKDDASDHNLIPATFTDLNAIFEAHRSIAGLVITGEYAEKWVGCQLEIQGLFQSGQVWRNRLAMPRPRTLTLGLDQRSVNVFTLPSPSRANNRVYALAKKVQMYRDTFQLLGVTTGRKT